MNEPSKASVFSSMDRLICRFTAVEDRELMVCRERGIAYQSDMSTHVRSSGEYKVADQDRISRAAMVNRHFGDAPILDIGVDRLNGATFDKFDQFSAFAL